MKYRLLVFFSLFLCAWLLVLLRTAPETKVPAKSPTVGQMAPPAEDPAAARERAAYEQETQARIEELKKIEEQRHARGQLEATSKEIRGQLQTGKGAVWSAIVGTNLSTFEALRKKAGEASEGSIACTICDGNGNMSFCALCESGGKCVTCQGTGKGFGGGTCPACGGTGKCYLCLGSGHMTCPFCDDGLVSANSPLPPAMIPVMAGTISQPPMPKGTPQVQQQSNVVSAVSDTAVAEAPVPAPAHAAQVEAAGPERYQNFVLAAAALLTMVLLARKLSPAIADFLETHFALGIRRAAPRTQDDRTEPQHFSELMASFQRGRSISPVPASPGGTSKANSDPNRAALEEFFGSARKDLAIVRSFLSEIAGAPEEAARQKLLVALSGQIGVLKRKSGLAELLPFWQMILALEGLLYQLMQEARSVTASTLLTVESALGVLDGLCMPGLRPDLATTPPIRILIVDRDPVISGAIAVILRLVFPKPESASSGEAALALTAEKPFDVIFLDAEMPGMEGSGSGLKFHETALNKYTPVVFVAGEDGSTARAQAFAGTCGLVTKPILPSQITLTALTCAMRARLGQRQQPETTAEMSQRENLDTPCPTSYATAEPVG